jgi:hypothetical protein
MKFWRRYHIASFALNGFNKDGSYFLRRNAPFEEVLTNPIHTGNTATGILLMMIRATVTIRIGDMSHSRDKWRESLLVNHFTGC